MTCAGLRTAGEGSVTLLRAVLYRFAEFELDLAAAELRRNGHRVRLHAQPSEVLRQLVSRPGELVTREEIVRSLWPDGTFVDYDHGLNSAINRLREALGDKASQPRFVETIARKGYRFISAVEIISEEKVEAAVAPDTPQGLDRFLASRQDLPQDRAALAQTLFLLLQVMYLAFYVGALANLREIADLMSVLPAADLLHTLLTVCAGVMIPLRLFLLSAASFRAPHFHQRFVRLWPWLALLDLAWSLAPLLLLHHINFGLALACCAPLVYAPFAQRSLVLMGAGASQP